MVDSQTSSYEALEQRPNSEDVELRSLASLDSQIHNDDHIIPSDQHGSTFSSEEVLHQTPDSENAEIARSHPLLQIEDAQNSSAPTEIECRSAVQRTGLYSVIILAATTIFMLGVFSFLASLSEHIDVPDHVDDTGQGFRAFLPFQDAQSRETISRYSGKAMVLDARVS